MGSSSGNGGAVNVPAFTTAEKIPGRSALSRAGHKRARRHRFDGLGGAGAIQLRNGWSTIVRECRSIRLWQTLCVPRCGTFSDGKLYTRATKRGSIRNVLELLVRHGASPDILIDAHPHVGTNRPPH
jgi:hypothetical protein